MNKIITALAAAPLLLATAGCGSDDSEGPAKATAPTSSTSTPPGESAECLSVAAGWVAMYDALDEATQLDDPTSRQAAKVVDDSSDMLEEINAECGPRLANAALAGHQQMLRVQGAITACDFTEMCGSAVDDELDQTMDAVDEVRDLVSS